MKKTLTLFCILFYSMNQSSAQTWLPMAAGLGISSESIKAIAENPNTHEIYAGGTFHGGSLNYIARWDGSAWVDLSNGLDGPVYALAFMGDQLYVGGAFHTAGGVSVNNIAQVNTSSGTWLDVAGGFNDQVNCIYIANDSGIYAGGRFGTASGTSIAMAHVAKLVNGAWTALGMGINNSVNAIAQFSGSIYAGSDNVSAPLSIYGGGSWSSVSGISSGKIYALASFSNYLYAGGDFAVPTFAAAKYNGTNWGTIQTTFSSSDKVYALSARNNAVLYIGGKFNNLGIPGSLSSFIARINSPVTPLQSITSTSSAVDGEVYAIGNMNGKVVAGGKFGSPAINIAITSSTIGVHESNNEIIGKTFYPNPVHDKAMLIVTTAARLNNPKLKIFDLQSKLIAVKECENINGNNSSEFFIDCGNFPKGEYYYLLEENNENILTDQFIVR